MKTVFMNQKTNANIQKFMCKLEKLNPLPINKTTYQLDYKSHRVSSGQV